VLDALMCRVRVVAECGADARDFVRRYTGTDASSTHHNAALSRTAHHGITDEPGDIWEINRRGTMRAEIRHLMPLSTQEIDYWAFEWKAGVIAANGKLHCLLLIRLYLDLSSDYLTRSFSSIVVMPANLIDREFFADALDQHFIRDNLMRLSTSLTPGELYTSAVM